MAEKEGSVVLRRKKTVIFKAEKLYKAVASHRGGTSKPYSNAGKNLKVFQGRVYYLSDKPIPGIVELDLTKLAEFRTPDGYKIYRCPDRMFAEKPFEQFVFQGRNIWTVDANGKVEMPLSKYGSIRLCQSTR